MPPLLEFPVRGFSEPGCSELDAFLKILICCEVIFSLGQGMKIILAAEKGVGNALASLLGTEYNPMQLRLFQLRCYLGQNIL